MSMFIGLARDAIAAALAVAILFGANFSDDQIAGILLLASTLLALGTWLWQQFHHDPVKKAKRARRKHR